MSEEDMSDHKRKLDYSEGKNFYNKKRTKRWNR